MDSDAVQLAKQMRARIVEPTVRKGADTPWHARGDVRCIFSFVISERGAVASSLCICATDSRSASRPVALRAAPCGRLPAKESQGAKKTAAKLTGTGATVATFMLHRTISLINRERGLWP